MRVVGLEIASKAGVLSVQTSAVGGNWVQLPAMSCAQVVLYNNSGTPLRIRYCDTAGNARAGETYLRVPDNVAQPMRGLKDASQLQIQRDDLSNTQVTVAFVYEAV